MTSTLVRGFITATVDSFKEISSHPVREKLPNKLLAMFRLGEVGLMEKENKARITENVLVSDIAATRKSERIKCGRIPKSTAKLFKNYLPTTHGIFIENVLEPSFKTIT